MRVEIVINVGGIDEGIDGFGKLIGIFLGVEVLHELSASWRTSGAELHGLKNENVRLARLIAISP